MSRSSLRFSRRAKLLLYGLFLTSFLSGTSWFTLHTWFLTEGDFGPEHSPWEPVLLKVHGASAFLLMIVFGWVLGRHVPAGWRSQRSRKSGVLLISLVSLMILSGYGLYYISDEALHELTVWVHLGSGLSLPLILGAHIWQAHRGRRPLPQH